MSNKHDIERCPRPDHPDRCQGQQRDSDQCMNMSLTGSKYCAAHGGNRAVQETEKKKLRNYQLTMFKARIDQFADNPGVKDLREEIGILRMMLETLLNTCKGASDLMMYASKIGAMVRDIDKLVNSAHKLESNMGVLLDKMAVLQLGQEIVEILSTELVETTNAILAFVPEKHHAAVRAILDNDLVDNIVDRMGEAMGRAHEPDG